MSDQSPITNTNISPEELPQARAERLLTLREMTGLSRDLFQTRYGIARGTLQNWESTLRGAA